MSGFAVPSSSSTSARASKVGSMRPLHETQAISAGSTSRTASTSGA